MDNSDLGARMKTFYEEIPKTRLMRRMPAAIRCVLEADSYEEFMRNVMSLRCDMDTLGAIGGGIAEELFGLGEFDVPDIFSTYLEPHLYDLAIK